MPSRSPLHGAVLRGELYTVKQLVWSRPDLVHQLDGKRRNPFILAVEKNQIEIAGFLVGQVTGRKPRGTSCGLSVCCGLPIGGLCLWWLQFPGLVESRGGRHNRTALHMVSHRGQHRLLQFLLQLGSSELEAKDRQGRTPVMLAVLARRMDVLAMLLHAGASLEARDWHGNRALHLASRCSGVHVCRRLVEMVGGERQPARRGRGRESTSRTVSHACAIVRSLLWGLGRAASSRSRTRRCRRRCTWLPWPARPTPAASCSSRWVAS